MPQARSPIPIGVLLLLTSLSASLLSCSDDTSLSVKSSPPVATITSPPEGAIFAEGEVIPFTAIVDDAEEPPEQLYLSWSDDIDGTLLDGDSADSEGIATFVTSNLSVGNHTVALSVIDSDALEGTDWVQITVQDTPDDPELTLVHPTSDESGTETLAFEFSVIVADEQDPPNELTLSFSSDLDGGFCDPTPDEAGHASCAYALSAGAHNLTFTVWDLDDRSFSRTAVFLVTAARDHDWDGDLWTEREGDCDETDSSVYPGATEFCNGSDDDCDGIIDEGTECFDDDGDGYTEISGDCNDSVATIYPGATEVCDGMDQDCDTHVDEDTPCVDDDGDFYSETDGDCDDTSAMTFPGAPETADAADNDCDGIIDEGTSARDDDGDCYCEIALTTGCSGSASRTCLTLLDGDCDDALDSVSPEASELCNTIDDDCDALVDEPDALGAPTWYLDADLDGFGTPSISVNACSAPAGYVSRNTDCNDSSSLVNPDSVEICNGIDDDCDGGADEGVLSIWYQDYDLDGYGNPMVWTAACAAPAGYVENALDCLDTNSSVWPGTTERCNGLDDDCDLLTDEADSSDAPTWYRDADSDGYGTTYVPLVACSAPAGYVASPADCDDSNNTVNPGVLELCNSVDDDCDGAIDEADASDAPIWYADADTDGYGSSARSTRACSAPSGYVSNGTDCNDALSSVHPTASESCNALDDDCDGATDEGVTTVYYRDADSDGYGNPSLTFSACSRPPGYAANAGDCDDTNAALNPTTVWYLDFDGDGYGNATYTVTQCAAPTGYVSNSSDCNDSTILARPGATESCDGIDNDCDGVSDESGATGCSTWYYDFDSDGYGSGSYLCLCSSSGYYDTLTGGDCYDANAYCYPGAPWASTTQRGDGSYDYDCDGAESRLYSTTYSCSVDWTGFSCTSYTNGWSGTTPSCGASGTWKTGCTASWWSCSSTSSFTAYQACY